LHCAVAHLITTIIRQHSTTIATWRRVNTIVATLPAFSRTLPAD
jgi:hypothetical protein